MVALQEGGYPMRCRYAIIRLPRIWQVMIMGTAMLLVGLATALFFSIYFMRKALRTLPTGQQQGASEQGEKPVVIRKIASF